ncbi:MAG: integrase domain-containing protein [Hydrogenophaga sp.]|uniref:site-specific integrase n=1 Tax=Hydrogenophaga sp. TaxID=1904254 RepID=UPI001D6E0BBA|nr:site-specific integrase [Hydrogenophaga sp.]MBX3610755.1 integrase domain-containing protein [Hydrogenophaga sp.]
MAKEVSDKDGGRESTDRNEEKRQRRAEQRAQEKEANRQMREEWAAQKAADTKKQRNTGALARVAQRAEFAHRNNAVAQAVYLATHGQWPAGTGRRRPMAESTLTEHKDALIRALSELKKEGMHVSNLSEIRRKHVRALIKRWNAAGLSYETIQNKVSKMRRLMTLLNKPDLVPRDSEYVEWLRDNGIVLVAVRKSKVALESKTWVAKGVDPMEVIDKVRTKHPIVAMCLELQYAFGLRAAEATHAEPVSGDLGEALHVRADARGGAKGGKSRTVPLSNDPLIREWQKDALKRAKELVRSHRQLRLTVPDKDYEQMQTHYYYVCRKFGITMKAMGVVPHGLRHMYAQRRHLELTGLPAPVVGTVPMSVYRANEEVLREGAQKVSLDMGHVRPSITTAYNGSVPSQSKEERARTQAWIDRLESCDGLKVLVKSLELRAVYLSGKAAQGVRLQKGDSVRLVVDKDASPQSAIEIGVLQRSLAGLIKLEEGLGVQVVHTEQAQDERDMFIELHLLA